MTEVLMPKATAVWLVDNTTLTFDQIAIFCNLHALEVQGIADGEVAAGIKGLNPITTGQLSQEEIDRCTNDTEQHLKKLDARLRDTQRRSKGPRYTPLSRRQDRPNAIAWLVRYHPELKDAQISKLVGTTKQTISAVRNRTHWNISNITPQDPVTLGLSSQVDLDSAVQTAQVKLKKQQIKAEKELAKRRAKNLTAAAGSGQPSAQSSDTLTSAYQNKTDLVENNNSNEPDSENSYGELVQKAIPEEDDSPKAEDVFTN